MVSESEPYTLAEAEVLAREAGAAAWWANSIMREYDRRGEALNQRLDPIETALEAQLGVAEEKVRQLEAENVELRRVVTSAQPRAVYTDVTPDIEMPIIRSADKPITRKMERGE